MELADGAGMKIYQMTGYAPMVRVITAQIGQIIVTVARTGKKEKKNKE